MMLPGRAAVWFMWLTAATSAFAQAEPLSMREAVARALANSPARKAAEAGVEAAQAGTREARAYLLPQISFTETATRGNDPAYVFTSKLRQQRFRAADFALDTLNRPHPFGNFSTRLGAEWRVFDLMETRHGVRRMQALRDAAAHQLTRAEQEVVLQAVCSYLGVLAARQQLAVAEQADKTAAAVLERVRSRHEQGMAVRSDLLSAEVNQAQRRQQLIRARNELMLAHAALNIAMSAAPEQPVMPAEMLAPAGNTAPALSEAETQALARRPDLKRVAAEKDAQSRSVAMAKSAFGPRVNAFGSWQTDTGALFGRGGNNWVGGLQVEVDIFRGGAKRARLQREEALARQSEAMRQAETDRVRLEVREAWYALDAARLQAEVARAVREQAEESYRIQQDRYEAGLAGLTDLLRVEEELRRTQSDYWNAVYRLRLGHAQLEFATGSLGPDSAVVTP